ncbi:MAG: nuclear transport factor 2 family protein [Deltaproteobacteria bacterium]|nr:nuclear transport factor 2 family protein [Deltaproteobacteria bacterium]
MTTELLVRRFWDGYNEGDPKGMTELFSDDARVEYVGEKRITCRNKKEIGQLFHNVIAKSKERLASVMSCPKTILAREDIAAVEWSSTIAHKSGASFRVRGISVFEVEGNRIQKMTVYIPTPTEKPFVLADKLSIKDLGELSLLAWAIV